jgi:hypothetical protein
MLGYYQANLVSMFIRSIDPFMKILRWVVLIGQNEQLLCYFLLKTIIENWRKQVKVQAKRINHIIIRQFAQIPMLEKSVICVSPFRKALQAPDFDTISF